MLISGRSFSPSYEFTSGKASENTEFLSSYFGIFDSASTCLHSAICRNGFTPYHFKILDGLAFKFDTYLVYSF